jgi:pimeloyl-ACP methyl ester carboxylesterase
MSHFGFERFAVVGHDRGGRRWAAHGARLPRPNSQSLQCLISCRLIRCCTASTTRWRLLSTTGSF